MTSWNTNKREKKEKKSSQDSPDQDNNEVRAKKFLGQHFLRDESIAQQIGDTLTLKGYSEVLEIGPGMGVLTKYLLQKDLKLTAMELDRESVQYLNSSFKENHAKQITDSNFKVVEADFLKIDLSDYFRDTPFAITGNFPYNISTQIVFRTLEWRKQIPEFSGMFQKEVALRICAKEGSKVYGILSVLAQAFYDAAYLFTVPPHVFSPPPKVDSGVIRLTRKENFTLPCNEKLFFSVVKTAFGQRRKTLRNSLKSLSLSDKLKKDTIFDKRPEQLSVPDFISLTQKIESDAIPD
ncbi:MAG: 16S rRNA (adenine(1518)-N(6)/adenine(1519)-N(6))-dimethyltransferase RsmA [Flavobacteriales bacterium]|nr:16S rRNA (adenine(1518)-N(6)/adenine(1519)-N(6))-dimethyltransferase RsmA [Flavobacteriales bacterium]